MLEVEEDVEVDDDVVTSSVLLLVDEVDGVVLLLVDEVDATVLVVGALVLLEVLDTGVVDDVVVLLPHVNAPSAELAAHESQQLSAEPTQATPPRDGLHFAALLLIEHLILPLLSTRQHVTAPRFPQVECAAQSVTALLHSLGRLPLSTCIFATSFTQSTYWP